MRTRYELLDEDINIEKLDLEEIKNLIKSYQREDTLSPDKKKQVKMLSLTLYPEDIEIALASGIEFNAKIRTKKFIKKLSVILNTKLELAVPLYNFKKNGFLAISEPTLKSIEKSAYTFYLINHRVTEG